MDWVWLYYLGTQVLKMREEEFWRCTFKKLIALYELDLEYTGKTVKKENEVGFIDEIFL